MKIESNVEDLTTPGPYYFFMKVGQGNVYLSQARRTNLMWVDFDFGEDHEVRSRIPPLATDPRLADFPTEAISSVRDLYFIAAATSEFVRSCCRIITFDAVNLHIWRIVGELTYLTPEVAAQLQVEFQARQKYFKVEKIVDVPRAKLLASISSLAVYRFLNQGTFRPVFRCNGSAFMDESQNSWLSAAPTLRPFWNQSETTYGTWVRLYLNSISGEKAGWPKLPLLNRDQIRELIPFVVSPAQLETAAMHFAQDLGLTVDVGAGKGLDRVDVRASMSHKEDRKQLATKAISICRERQLNLGTEIIDCLIKDFTLSIQCKNYESQELTAGTQILMFCSFGEVRNAMVSLQQLVRLNASEFVRLNDWTSLVETQIRAACEGKV